MQVHMINNQKKYIRIQNITSLLVSGDILKVNYIIIIGLL